MASPGEVLGGRYVLVQQIGTGGMATVWRAHDLTLRRQVAVKLLRPELAADEDLARRFESEARHAASLSHQNVATVFDAGTDPQTGEPFIVMELVDGPTVADVIARGGPIEPEVAAEIASGAARALAAAHRRGLIHRDVKPANLLIGRDGRVRLADFGIARALTAGRVTMPGTVLGSIPYLSPEQARGEGATASGDIFSLGVVLFEMLTGRLPWSAETPAAMATVRTDVPAPSPSAMGTGVPEDLDAIVGKALAVDPADRYPSARRFADALEGWNRRHRGATKESLASATTALAARVGAPSRRLPRAMAGAGASSAPTGVAASRTTTGDDAGDAGADSRAATFGAPAAAAAVTAVAAGTAGTAAGGVSATSVTAGVRNGAPSSRPVDRRSSPRADVSDRRGIRTRTVAQAIGLFALLLLFVFGGAYLLWPNERPAPSAGGVAVAIPTASPTVSPTTASAAGPSPTATLAPTSEPTPSPTVATTPRPTPGPTPRPTPVVTPRPDLSPAAAAVVNFYNAVTAHDWDAALALWSPSMQQRYPPQEFLIDRFEPTTLIDITRLRTVSFDPDAGRARVAISLVEYRSVEPSPRTFVGAWDLVLSGGQWLLDDPDF